MLERLPPLKSNEVEAVESYVEALRRELDGKVLLLLLFGSKARGDSDPDSDIDFLMVTEPDPHEVRDEVIRLESEVMTEHSVELNTLFFSRERWADFASRRAAFWQNAQREGVLLLRSPQLPDSLVTAWNEEDRMPDHSPEIAAYMEGAREALRDAEFDMQSGQYHEVANRSYYAIFYAANAMLAAQGLQRSKHSGVKSLFSEKYIKTGMIEPFYGKFYEAAMERRHASDYDMTTNVNEEYVQVSLEAAQQFVARVEQHLLEHGFLSDEGRKTIREVMGNNKQVTGRGKT